VRQCISGSRSGGGREELEWHPSGGLVGVRQTNGCVAYMQDYLQVGGGH